MFDGELEGYFRESGLLNCLYGFRLVGLRVLENTMCRGRGGAKGPRNGGGWVVYCFYTFKIYRRGLGLSLPGRHL